MRVEEKFNQLKKEGRKAFNVYFPFGFPSLSLTPEIFFVLQDAGVDIIELGFPFSDPLADGPIIQRASTTALKQKLDLDIFFKTLKKMKKKIKIPIVAMSYYNPIFRYGVSNFFKRLEENDISASVIVDVPVEESRLYLDSAKRFNINPIFFITPATSLKRAKQIIKVARGFIYYVSVAGTTGPRSLDFDQIASQIEKIKKLTAIPVCVGFGIHNQKQVKRISSFADGVIVGSEVVRFIEKNYKKRDFLKRLEKKVKSLHVPKS